MLFRPLKIGQLFGADIFLNWTMWLLPLFILIRGLFLYANDEVVMQLALVAGVYVCLLAHEAGHLVVARWLALGIRDVTIYPIGGTPRLKVISDRPWKEVWVAAVGPMAHVMIAGLIALGFMLTGLPLTPRAELTEPFVETYFNRLFWLNVLFVVLSIIPAFPLDGGYMFRGSLALSAQRLRATEVSSMLSSFVALLMLIPGMVWMSMFWWLILLGIIIHVSGQQQLMIARYFASLQQPGPGGSGAPSPILVPVDQMLEDINKPDEPNFSGMIFNPKTRLWIVWHNGQPISANALVGE